MTFLPGVLTNEIPDVVHDVHGCFPTQFVTRFGWSFTGACPAGITVNQFDLSSECLRDLQDRVTLLIRERVAIAQTFLARQNDALGKILDVGEIAHLSSRLDDSQ